MKTDAIKRLARVNGRVTAIVTGQEFVKNGIVQDGKNYYPATIFGEPDTVQCIIRTGSPGDGQYFDLTGGEKYWGLEDWKI